MSHIQQKEYAKLNEIQDKVYSTFVEFDRVCRKHGIKYSMEGGTLLGAVKYQGFVPWDDDIDVIMLREEYNKFLKVAPKELSGDYFLQSYNNVPSFPLNYAKLCFNNSKICDYAYSHINDMNHGIFIDIFPIDNVIPKKLKTHCSKVGLLTSARKLKLKVQLRTLPFYKKIIYGVLSLLPMKSLCALINKACCKYNGKDTGYKYEVCNSNIKFKPLSSDIYHNLTELKFRDGIYYAVKNYDEFLRSRFGDDYMSVFPPEDKRKPSHCSNIIINE